MSLLREKYSQARFVHKINLDRFNDFCSTFPPAVKVKRCDFLGHFVETGLACPPHAVEGTSCFKELENKASQERTLPS